MRSRAGFIPVAPDAAAAQVVRRQADVVRAMEVVERATVAVVGIGAWAPGLSSCSMVTPMTRRAAAVHIIGDQGRVVEAVRRGSVHPFDAVTGLRL